MTDKELLKYCNEYFRYDPIEGVLVWKKRAARCIEIGDIAGSARAKSGYVYVQLKSNLYLAHRLGFLMHHGYLPKFVDHRNQIKFDNRIDNLRPATRAENSYNRGILKSNTSGYNGVVKIKNKCSISWRAHILLNGKHIYIGQFKNKDDAARAWNIAAIKYHGEFAYQNIIE